MSTVMVENIGAVQRVEIPVPAEGGLVVLRGRQGAGKSTALRAIDSLLAGEGSLDKRDGTPCGRVQGFGATLTVKKSTRRQGTLEVESLEGRLSVAELVDPHIGDPAKADARRIKALVQLAAVEPDPSLFTCVFDDPEQYEGIVEGLRDDATGDIVQLAATVKRRIEAEARTCETSAERCAATAAAHRQSAGPVAATSPASPAELQAALEDAVRLEAKLKSDAAAAVNAAKNAEAARVAIENARVDYWGPTAADAARRVTDASAAVIEATRVLNQARHALSIAEGMLTAAREGQMAAERHERSMAAWQAAIDAAAVTVAPDPAAIAEASAQVTAARQAIEQAALQRKAATDLELAKLADVEAGILRDSATGMRAAAGRIDGVLSGVVGKLNCPLRIRDGRLILDTDRGEELFADLSDGERWRIALDTVIPFLPADGVLTIPQSAYGELDPINRREIHDLLRARGVVMITAEATADEGLHANVFEE